MFRRRLMKFACVVASCMLMICMAGCEKKDNGASSEGFETGSTVMSSSDDGASKENESKSTEEKKEDKFPDRANATEGKGKVKELKEGDVAPDFTADLVDGSTFTLSDYDDKVVILNFFATWCGPCVREMPAFEMLKADGYSDLAILCVDCMEGSKTVDAFVKENGFTFPIAYDEKGTIENYYPTDGIPYTLIINQGVIAKIYLGARDAQTQYNEYKSAIDACLAK